MELTPQHGTTPDRKGRQDLPREWAILNSTLWWDEITPRLQAIGLYWVTEHTDTWTLPADRHHPLLIVQGDATITSRGETPGRPPLPTLSTWTHKSRQHK